MDFWRLESLLLDSRAVEDQNTVLKELRKLATDDLDVAQLAENEARTNVLCEETRLQWVAKAKLLLLQEDPSKSARIVFLGSPGSLFHCNEKVVVSFPGAHGLAWTVLTADSQTRLLTSCVFLPDETAEGYGIHVEKRFSRECFCCDLYGKPQPWGCKWYEVWMKNTRKAALNDCSLIVVTKQDGSLGNSQEGEVKYLRKRNYPFMSINISDFADLLLKYDDQYTQIRNLFLAVLKQFTTKRPESPFASDAGSPRQSMASMRSMSDDPLIAPQTSGGV